jgi:polysaccharide pyruvyl transferase WcaK-like protein
MRILHTYCLNYNIGDYALGLGLKNLLRHFLNVDLIGDTNIQGRNFDEYYINNVVNKKYDLLVIGGGGIIHGSHWPNGWFWLIDKELIKTIKIPFVVYAVGNNYFEGEPSIPDKAIAHLHETFKKASFFSVRNDGSYERILEQTGINANEIPDPGFHVDLNSEYDRFVEDPYVVIQVANDKPGFRYGNKTSRKSFITSMKGISKELIKDYRVIFAPHVFDDVSLSHEIADGIQNCEVWDFGYFAFDHSDKAVGYYKYAEFVLAMRGHGQILPIGFGVPVISLQNHPKHIGLMKKLDLLDYNVNIADEDFEDKLRKTISKLVLTKAKLHSYYKSINENLFKKTTRTFNEIKMKINEFK